jgi:hypothetical protein
VPLGREIGADPRRGVFCAMLRVAQSNSWRLWRSFLEAKWSWNVLEPMMFRWAKGISIHISEQVSKRRQRRHPEITSEFQK